MFKKFFMLSLLLFIAFPVFADEKGQALSLSGYVTYGSYSGSVQRDSIILETLVLSYLPGPEYGAGLMINNSVLKRKAPLDDINGTNISASYFWTPKTNTGSFIGGKVNALLVNSDDRNSDNTIIPYLSFIYKSADLRRYFDLGYARTAYNDTTANQYTLT